MIRRVLLSAALLLAATGCEWDEKPVLKGLDHPTRPVLDDVPYEEVSFPELLAHPDRYKDRGVTFLCRFHSLSEVFTPAYTEFNPATHAGFSVWAPDAPIWEPEGFGAEFPFCYADRRHYRGKVLKEVLDLDPFVLIEVEAYVSAVFGGRPYLRVDSLDPEGGPEISIGVLKGIHAGLTADRQGRWTDGVLLCRQALDGELPPGAEEVLRRSLGHCLLESGEPRKALTELGRAAEAFPEDVDILKWEGRASRAASEMGKGRHARAVAFLEQAQAKAPEDPEIPLLLAEAYLAAGRPEDAIASAGRGVALAPKDPEAHLELAALLAGQNQLDGAVRSFRNALALDPARWTAWRDLARVQVRRSDFAGAAASFEKAFAKGGPAVPADDHYLAGRCYQSLGKVPEARRAYAAALALPGPWGGAADTWAALGELDFGGKEFGAAAKSYEAALAERPKDPEFLAYLGVARLKAGDPAGARKALEEALDRGVDRPAVVGEDLARACFEQGDLPAAARAIDRACGREETASRRFFQGTIARLRNEHRQAERAFGRAAALDPKDVHAHLNQAIALVALESYGKALEALAEGEKASPGNPLLMTVRAYAMLKEGADMAGALPVAEKAFGLLPEKPDAKHAYGWALLANGKAEQALPLLQDAAKDADAAGGVPEVSLHLAQALIATGKPEEARPVLEAVAKTRDPAAKQARSLLKTLPKAAK